MNKSTIKNCGFQKAEKGPDLLALFDSNLLCVLMVEKNELHLWYTFQV